MAEVGKFYITVMPDMSKFQQPIAAQAKSTGKLMDTILGTGLGVMLGTAASKALGAVMDSLGAGIKRLDTIEAFGRVMASLGEPADAVASSIAQMKKALDGLPTSTAQMSAWTQQVRAAGEPLGRATKLAIGWNNALLAGGKSSAEVSNAMDAFNKMLAAGKVDLEHWNTLLTTSPAALNQLAVSLLGAGHGSKDLYDALKSGKVSMDEFNDAVIRLNEEGGEGFKSFEEQARAATGGIGTAIENVKNRLAAAWATILETIGSDRIAAAINSFSSSFSGVAKNIAGIVHEIDAAVTSTFESVAEKLSASGFKASIDGMMQSIGQLGGKLAELGGMLFEAVRGFSGASDSVSAFDVVASVAAGTIQTVVGVVRLFADNISDLINRLNENGMGEALNHLGASVQLLGAAFQQAAPFIQPVIDFLKELFAEVAPLVVNFVAEVIQAVAMIVLQFTNMVNEIKRILDDWKTKLDEIKAAVDLFKSQVAQAFMSLVAPISQAIETAKTTIVNTWNNIKTQVGTAVDGIKTKITTAFNTVATTVGGIFNRIKEAITKPINDAKTAISNAISKIASIISGVKLQLPKIALPHFSVSGGEAPWGIGGMGTPPKFSVSWYKRGGLVNGAQLIGAGEAGHELIWPSYSPYLERYAGAIAERIGAGGDTYITIDGSTLQADERMAALVAEVVDLAVGLKKMGRV